METLAILLLLFALNGQGGDLKRTLSDLLVFYRENRDIIRLIAGTLHGAPLDAPDGNAEKPAPDACAHEKSRPQSEVGNADILREFLEKRAV